MAEPVSWQALERVKSMLQGIAVAAGYFTDLGAGEITLDTAQKPVGAQFHTVVAAGDMPVDESASGNRFVKGEMEIVIEVSIPFEADEVAELLAHRARADVIRALRAGARGAATGITSLQITGSRIGPPDTGAAAVIAQVTARAGLTESMPPANP